MITTLDEFIDALGGTGAAARAFDSKSNAVSNWKGAGRFPAWAAMRARDIAQENKMLVDPRLFETLPVRIDRSGTHKPAKRTTKATARPGARRPSLSAAE